MQAQQNEQLSPQSAKHNQWKCKKLDQVFFAQLKKSSTYLHLKYTKLVQAHNFMHIHSGILKITVFSICLTIGQVTFEKIKQVSVNQLGVSHESSKSGATSKQKGPAEYFLH